MATQHIGGVAVGRRVMSAGILAMIVGAALVTALVLTILAQPRSLPGGVTAQRDIPVGRAAVVTALVYDGYVYKSAPVKVMATGDPLVAQVTGWVYDGISYIAGSVGSSRAATGRAQVTGWVYDGHTYRSAPVTP
jgi:hypothetical protein